MARRVWVKVPFLVGALTIGASAHGARGEPGRPPGGGEESAVNNLSFPVLFTGAPLATIPSEVAQGAYSLLGNYYLWDGVSSPCDPDDLSCTLDPATTPYRIYVQKDPANDWQAQWLDNQGTVGISHLDVSDNLESVPWRTTSSVRVEFVPFAPALSLLGFEMDWISGQGIDELWGAEASNSGTPVASTFYPGYATVYSGCAALSFTKLESGSGSIEVLPDPAPQTAPVYQWDPTADVWKRSDGTPAAYTTKVTPMSAEINVKGRLIYGYNWMLKRQVVPSGVTKDGWWRLTFFDTCATAPFDFTAATQVFDPTVAVEPSEGEDGGEVRYPNYPRVPYVDPARELVFIDVYIQASAAGGGKGRRN